MKYTVSIDIDRPVGQVAGLFAKPENMKQWMPQLSSIELVSGAAGQLGAMSRMVFLNNGRQTEMLETITARNLPSEAAASYEFKGGTYAVTHRFEALPGGKTRYISEQDFQMQGLMKFMGLLMPWAFKRESMKHMTLFKQFVESQP